MADKTQQAYDVASATPFNALYKDLGAGTQFAPAVVPVGGARAQLMLNWSAAAGGASESALANFTNGTLNASALGAASSYTVSAGKTLRIQQVIVTLQATGATLLWSRVRIRQAPSAIANTSPIIFNAEVVFPPGTGVALAGTQIAIPIPDGLEVAAGQQITMTHIESSATGTVSVTIIGYEY